MADSGPAKDGSAAERRAVVVHAGARDAYQVALALAERGMLESLVTDLFWAEDSSVERLLGKLLPRKLRSLLLQRSAAGLSFRQVRLRALGGLWSLALEKSPWAPLSLRRRTQRRLDAVLGRSAGCLARSRGAGLVTYSYYGYDAISQFKGPALLFQLHPHPATMRRILQQELLDHPDCAASLKQEWELALPEEDYQHLVRETQMASRFLVASSFTRASLVEHGADPASISVVPYGVDLERFRPAPLPRATKGSKRLELLFVGRINQRKGIKYLLEALRLLDTEEVHLTVCGRVLDDLALFRPFGDRVTIRPSVSADELLLAYQSADLFVFPSVAEGFGQVLLESLACGLPILSTTRTAAPDLITDGVEGFIVEPRDPEALAQRIRWALSHREELEAMRQSARACAEQFTWGRFRNEIGSAVVNYLESLGSKAQSD